MLDQQTRTAILRLHREGHGARTIAQALGISRNAVRRVLAQGEPAVPAIERESSLDAHIDQIRELYAAARGNRVRVHEELTRAGVTVGYATLTRYCRTHDIGVKSKKPVGHYTFEPGEEMQHDTSPHSVVVGGRPRLLQCASLVLAWSRMTYAQCYPTFNRFYCRVFLQEALQYFGGAPGRCVVDNTSVVVVGGSGPSAAFADELVALGDRFGFQFMAHAVGHAERSGRVERPFHYIENNFYPLRTFDGLDDLNAQLRNWCDDKNATFRRRLGASPRERLVAEAPRLHPLPLHIPEVYCLHVRRVDVEGFVTLHTNRYSVPLVHIGHQVQIRETADRVVVMHGHKEVADHRREEPGAQKRKSLPEHEHRFTQARRAEPSPFEKDLRAIGPELSAFVDALKAKHKGRAHRELTRVHRMYVDYPTPALRSAIERANAYRLTDLARVERLVLRETGGSFFSLNPLEDDDGRRPGSAAEGPQDEPPEDSDG
jgi:transposase